MEGNPEIMSGVDFLKILSSYKICKAVMTLPQFVARINMLAKAQS